MEEHKLSWSELEYLTDSSVDSKPFGKVVRSNMNSHLTNSELVDKIKYRNSQGKPTYLLRQEYETRLENKKE